MRVDDALARARELGVDRLDAQLLLARRLGRPRGWLIAHGDAPVDGSARDGFEADVARRAAGEPLAYITGRREFHGLELEVTPAVLVPRPDTETLVDWGLALLAGELAERAAPLVVDLGTGSGAIALALKHAAARAQVHACDADAQALAVADRNARRLGLSIELHRSSWWDAMPAGFDLALSNPPYIAEDDTHLLALGHEPRHALTPGGDGLSDLREIVARAPAHLSAGGWLLLEHGHDQAPAVRKLLLACGFADVGSRHDLAGHERCSGGRWPG